MTNSVGALANTYAYDSYCRLTASSGTLVNSFQYTGREFDSETGIYYYPARYYSSQMGRCASEDSAGFAFGPNVYQYTYDSPTNFIDPLGVWPNGTVSVGGTINVNLGFWSGQYSGGFVIDTQGGVGVYNTYTPLPGGSWGYGGVSNVGNYGSSGYYPLQPRPGSTASGGWHGNIGLSLAVSNAHSICDLAGPFVNGSAGAGAGADVSIDGLGARVPAVLSLVEE